MRKPSAWDRKRARLIKRINTAVTKGVRLRKQLDRAEAEREKALADWMRHCAKRS